ncbi:hypothetical protein [Clostridium butyricum]|uniref:EAL domain-containing protein n=1 Tax=Clostridium butyricum TaxID=1492 RepID=A0A6N3ACA4_CLOBU
MNLEDYLNEYKALTLDIMEKVNKDGMIEYLVNERQMVLDKIKNMNFLQAEIKKITDSLNIVQLDRELDLLVKKEKVATRKKIERLKKMKNANMQYMSIGYVPSKFNKHM